MDKYLKYNANNAHNGFCRVRHTLCVETASASHKNLYHPVSTSMHSKYLNGRLGIL